MRHDYAAVVAFLSARRAPYGLVHDLRTIPSLHTLAPIARQLLADATTIAQSGLVRRVGVLHSIRGAIATAAMHSLLKLSPVHPARAFVDADAGLGWARGWALATTLDESLARSRACSAPHARSVRQLMGGLVGAQSRPAVVEVRA